MDEKNDFKILHISYKQSSPEDEYNWLRVNLVFRVVDEYDLIVCKSMSEEWSKASLYEVDDPVQIHNHFLHTGHEFKKIENTELSRLISFSTDPEYDISDKHRVGFSLNPNYILQYIEKFNVFVYRDFVEDNPVTRATLSMLEDLKNTGKSTSRFVSFSIFTRCITTLNTFWD
jgi:hypothetical protein